MDLKDQKCVPCEGGTAPLTKDEAEIFMKQVSGWTLSENAKNINKKFAFKNFKEALNFVNKVGDIAESEGHHPDIHLTDYKFVKIDLSTHAIGGLSQNDFILAAKIDNEKNS